MENKKMPDQVLVSNEQLIEGDSFKYMGEFMEDLPENCFLNKVKIGCGGTTLALVSDMPYVIAVPYKNLIINKLDWAKKNSVNLLGVMEGVTDLEIESFKGNKIMCTYDSLKKLSDLLEKSGKLKDYCLLIDEAHKLVDSGDFRGRAVQTVLDNFKKYRTFTFLTATPVPDRYQLPELSNIPQVKIKWDNLQPVKISYFGIKQSLFISSIATQAGNYIKGKGKTRNLHIFLNSVYNIIDIVKALNSAEINTATNISIICANHKKNRALIKLKLGESYDIVPPGKVNRVNFYTATAFEGSDIYDKDGVCLIAVNQAKHTKIDILTTLPQIAGRLRDSKFKNNINMIFNPTRWTLEKNEKEHEKIVKNKLYIAGEVVTDYNNCKSTRTKKLIRKGANKDPYLTVSDNNISVSSTAWYSKMNAFNTINNTYLTIGEIHTKIKNHNDIEYRYVEHKELGEIDETINYQSSLKGNFVNLCERYIEAVQNKNDDLVLLIATDKPIIKKAHDNLGVSTMKALKYRKKAINTELHNLKTFEEHRGTIVYSLNYGIGEVVSSKKIKESLQNIYNGLNLSKTATGTEINTFYKTKKTSITIDGKKETAYKILTNKFLPNF